MRLLKKAIATSVILLVLAGTMTVSLITYKVYQTYETSKITSKSVECINKRLDYCTVWSNLDFGPSRPNWDASCGDEPSEDLCKNIIKGGPITTISTTSSTSTTSTTSTSSTSTSTTSTSTSTTSSTSTSSTTTSTTSTSTSTSTTTTSTTTSTTSTSSTSTSSSTTTSTSSSSTTSTSTSTTSSTTTTICTGTAALDCLTPDPGTGNERLWGDTVCNRINVGIDCDGIPNSHYICQTRPNGPCVHIEPSTTGYSVSSNLIALYQNFTVKVSGSCPSNLPGKCIVECRVTRPDGSYIYLDAWDEDGSVTLPDVTCTKIGNYVIDYCVVKTDFVPNYGWGIGDNTVRVVNCVGDCTGAGGVCKTDPTSCAFYCAFNFRLSSQCPYGFSQCGFSKCCCKCFV